jgi:hypothetical protein
MHGREYVVAVRPKGRGLVMHTLYRADEMQTMDAVESWLRCDTTADPKN